MIVCRVKFADTVDIWTASSFNACIIAAIRLDSGRKNDESLMVHRGNFIYTWSQVKSVPEKFRHSSSTMFSVVPLAPRSRDPGFGNTRHHPSVQEDIDMKLEDDYGAGPSMITSPGEVISSSAAVLRWVVVMARYMRSLSNISRSLIVVMELMLKMKKLLLPWLALWLV